MNPLDSLKSVLGRLIQHGQAWVSPGGGPRKVWHFIGWCMRRLSRMNAMAMSSALSFRTIFALVPTIVLAVVALKTFGAFDRGRQSLRKILDSSGFTNIVLPESQPATAPASGPASAPATQPATQPGRVLNVADEIEAVVGRVEAKLTFGTLGPVGMAVLIWTALTLLTTMERSLNRIFGAPRSRGLGRRTMLYWSAMTLGPLAAGLATLASEKALAFMERSGGLSWILAGVGWLQPILVGVVLLTACYTLMPNTRVSLRAALGGAVVAYTVWLVAKWGFGIYVQELVAKGNVYGSIGLLPLFLLWLNLSWYLFLFGAEIAHTAETLDEAVAETRADPFYAGPWDLLAAAVAVAERFADDAGPATAADVAAGLRLSKESAGTLLDRLAAGEVVCRVEDTRRPAFLPRTRPDKLPVTEVLGLTGRNRPSSDPGRFGTGVAHAVRRAQAAAVESLRDMTLADLLAAVPAETTPTDSADPSA